MALNLVRMPHPVTLEGMTAQQVPPGGTVANFVAPADGDVHAFVNGQPVPAQQWDRPLRDGDVLILRAAVAGDDTDPLRTVLQIALVVASFAAGATILSGLSALKAGLAQAAILVGGSLIINAIAPPRLPGLNRDTDAVEPVYSLVGGANRARPYAPQLLVFGSHRVFPDLGAAEYTTFGRAAPVGEATIAYTLPGPTPGYGLPVLPRPRAAAPGGSIDQYLHQVFHWGLGNLAVSDLRMGDTLLTDFEGVETQWSDADGAITLVAGNVDTEAGAVLEDTDWVPRTTAAGTTRVELDFQASLFRIDDDGDTQSHSVTLQVEMWPTSDTTAVRRFTLTLTHGKTSPHRLTVPYELDPAGQWTVRVKRTTAPSDDNRTYDDVVWAQFRSFQPDEADYAGQTRLGLRIRASGQLQGRVDRLSGSVDQLVPAWDGSAWVDDQVTSNPAWIYRWYARGVREDGDLLAGVGLAAASVDDAELKLWGAWCDTHGLKFDYVLDRDLSHAEVLALIAQCGRASPSWHTGRLGVVYDQEGRAPTFYYGPGNIVDDSMEVDWISGAIAQEIVVRYRDPDLDWQYNTVRRNVPHVTAPDRTATLTRDGITDRDQAAKECNLQAARQLYHRRRLRWQSGPEGLSRARGQVGYLSHALVSGGVTGRVLRGTRSELTLSQPVALPANPAADRPDDYLLLYLPNGDLHTSRIARASGSADPDETDRVTLATPVPDTKAAPAPLDTLWRHYQEDAEPLQVKIVSVEPQTDGTVALEAIDEVAAYYAAATSDLTVDLPQLRRRWPRVLGIELSEELIDTGSGYLVELTATLDVAGDWRGGEILAALDDGPEKIVARLREGDVEGSWAVPTEGTVRIRAVPGSAAAPAGRSHSVTHEIRGLLTEISFDGGADGYGVEEAYALFPAGVLVDGTLTIPANQQPDNGWRYDQLSQAPVTRGGIEWTDGPAAPTADNPVRVKALRRVPGLPATGAAPAASWGDWAWYPDAVRPADGRFTARELDVYLVVDAPPAGGAAPATPTAESYRFTDDVLVGLTPHWVRTRPLAVDPGQLVYCCTASAIDDGTGSDTSIAFSAPVRCNDVLDIDIVYRRYPSGTTTVARPANTAHDAIATGWYARAGLIPAAQTGVLWECVRYLKVSGADVRWEYDDPYRSQSDVGFFRQPVVEVPIRALGESITADGTTFDPNPAEAVLVLQQADGSTLSVSVNGVVAAAGVTVTLTGDDAAAFEIVE